MSVFALYVPFVVAVIVSTGSSDGPMIISEVETGSVEIFFFETMKSIAADHAPRSAVSMPEMVCVNGSTYFSLYALTVEPFL